MSENKNQERTFLEFIKCNEGVSVNIEEKTEIIDVLVGIGLTIDMITRQHKVSKKEVLKDIDDIRTILEKENKKKKGEKKDVSK